MHTTFVSADRATLAVSTALVVDDDPTMRRLIASFLRGRVGRVIEAESGEAGVVAFERDRPTILLTDLHMPGIDGLELAAHVREVAPETPVLLITSSVDAQELERARALGIDAYLLKPVDASRLDGLLLGAARRVRTEGVVRAAHRAALVDAKEQQRRALGVLAGGMAHDFNNLLQVVLLNLEDALTRTTADDERHELLRDALTAAEGARELGARLRMLHDGSHSRLRPAGVEASLRAALDEALAGRSTQLSLTVTPQLPTVDLDHALLTQAFVHLAVNGCEAMHDAGTLHVTVTAAAHDAACVEVAFRDEGPGIPREVGARLFEPYVSTKPRGAERGTGLGLALCRAIVTHHGGTVELSSRPEEGAVATVRLPASNHTLHDSERPSVHPPPLTPQTLHEGLPPSLRAVFELVREGVCVIDLKGSLLDANDAFLQLIGQPRAARVALTLADWDTRADVQPEHELAAMLAQELGPATVLFRRADGTPIEVEVRASAFILGGERLVLLTAHDLTEQRALSMVETTALDDAVLLRLHERAPALANAAFASPRDLVAQWTVPLHTLRHTLTALQRTAQTDALRPPAVFAVVRTGLALLDALEHAVTQLRDRIEHRGASRWFLVQRELLHALAPLTDRAPHLALSLNLSAPAACVPGSAAVFALALEHLLVDALPDAQAAPRRALDVELLAHPETCELRIGCRATDVAHGFDADALDAARRLIEVHLHGRVLHDPSSPERCVRMQLPLAPVV